jgi:hypothetical protein
MHLDHDRHTDGSVYLGRWFDYSCYAEGHKPPDIIQVGEYENGAAAGEIEVEWFEETTMLHELMQQVREYNETFDKHLELIPVEAEKKESENSSEHHIMVGRQKDGRFFSWMFPNDAVGGYGNTPEEAIGRAVRIYQAKLKIDIMVADKTANGRVYSKEVMEKAFEQERIEAEPCKGREPAKPRIRVTNETPIGRPRGYIAWVDGCEEETTQEGKAISVAVGRVVCQSERILGVKMANIETPGTVPIGYTVLCWREVREGLEYEAWVKIGDGITKVSSDTIEGAVGKLMLEHYGMFGIEITKAAGVTWVPA